MILFHDVVIACPDTTVCVPAILARMQHGPSLKLSAEPPDFIVHGSLVIVHRQPPRPHTIRVELYDRDEPPNQEHQKSHLKIPTNPPDEAEIRRRLNTP